MTAPVPFTEHLRSAVGAPRRATPLDSSPRSRVWRVGLSDGRRVAVKQITDDGAPGVDADSRFAREVAALRLAGRAAAPAVAPALLATDPTVRTMVLELLDTSATPEDWLPGYAEALARLHTLTGPGDAGVLPAWAGPTAADAESFLALARRLDVPVPPGVPDELAALLVRLDPAPHHALLHGDPCPGNDVHTGDGVRFLDFEGASLGNGLIELAYFRVGLPTCWCAMSVTGAPLAEAEGIYRSTWRDLTGREVPGDLADACAAWLIRGDSLVQRAERGTVDHFARVPGKDFTWGYITARERLVHRLDVVARLARDHDHLASLGRLCSGLANRLLTHRPAPRPLPTHRSRAWL